MRIADFKEPEFTMYSQLKLTEWVINGDYNPEVEVYQNNSDKEYYQVSKKHKKFRQTMAAADGVLTYGAWQNLND